MPEIIVAPKKRKATTAFEPVIFADHPIYEIVSENDDGTWTIWVPD